MNYKGEPLWYLELFRKEMDFLFPLLKKNNIHFWLDFGTLLGAIREGKIIPWDFDVDISIFLKDYQKLAALESTIIKAGHQIQGLHGDKSHVMRVFETQFDFHIDIWVWRIAGDTAWLRVGTGKQNLIEHPISVFENVHQVMFENSLSPCPINHKTILDRWYGEDWMVPKILSGNAVYLKKFAPDNIDIWNEIKKYESMGK